MTQIVEDYISFKTAKLLKEKWFKFLEDPDKIAQVYIHAYTKEGKEVWGCYDPEYCPCITLNMACKWLREVHGLFISLEPCFDYKLKHAVYLAFIQNVADIDIFKEGRVEVASGYIVEAVYGKALKYCLEHLI